MTSTFSAVTLDLASIDNVLMGRTDIVDLFTDSVPPLSDDYTKVILLNQHIFLLNRGEKQDQRYLTISLAPDGPLANLPTDLRDEALLRILRVALISINQKGAIPVSWRPFHAGKFISIQSNSRASGEVARIMFDTRPLDEGHVYAFGIDTVKGKLENATPNYDALLEAAELIPSIGTGIEQPRIGVTEIHSAHRLSNALLNDETTQLTFQEWIDSRLTHEQLKFVNHPLTQSIRLIGPAGSGKTIALTVKALKELSVARAAEKPLRILFLTHATSTVDLVNSLLDAMDPDGEILLDPKEESALEVATIYSIANKHMHYDLEGLQPLSLDGADNRKLQFELLEGVITEFLKDDWVAYRASVSDSFSKHLEENASSLNGRIFVWELMNEFACVLDADGIRSSGDRRKGYLTDKRKEWMMPLQPGAEREVVLELHRRFKKELQDMRSISGDQMIADYLNWLDSNRWENLRTRLGYDAVFVDELHLFNRQERMSYRHLLRDPDAPPVVVMAYDPKQSPRDTFLGLDTSENTSNYWRDSKLGRTEKYEFVDIFRYTPQITSALVCIDQSFPGQNLDEDWPAYSGVSKISDGPIPLLSECKTTEDLYTLVFPRARDQQRKIKNTGRVAVLCASNQLFPIYAEAGQFQKDFVLISSREDLPRAGTASGKFIFSTPEYVAGLQFDTVFLIEANEDEVPDTNFRVSALRKFLSTIYLGASRAERVLEIFASKEHGGASKLFDGALKAGAIAKVSIQDLPHIPV